MGGFNFIDKRRIGGKESLIELSHLNFLLKCNQIRKQQSFMKLF